MISCWCAVAVIATGAIAIASKIQQRNLLEDDDDPSLDGDIEVAMSKTREGPIVDEESGLAGSVVDKTVPSGKTLEKQVSGAFQEVEESSQNRSSAVKDSLDTSSAIDRDISTGLKLSADFTKAQVDASEVFDDKTGDALL